MQLALVQILFIPAVTIVVIGNNYNVQKFGNTTNVYGNNSRTGSNWSSSSTDFGTMTITNGTTNGKSWNKTDTKYGSYGTDSNGRSFNYNR